MTTPEYVLVPAGWRPVPVDSLVQLAGLIDPAPVEVDGKTMVFRNPMAAEVLAQISAVVRTMFAATPASAAPVPASLSVQEAMQRSTAGGPHKPTRNLLGEEPGGVRQCRHPMHTAALMAECSPPESVAWHVPGDGKVVFKDCVISEERPNPLEKRLPPLPIEPWSSDSRYPAECAAPAPIDRLCSED